MKAEYFWVAAIIIVGAGSYRVGQESGLKGASEYISYLEKMDAEYDAWEAEFDKAYPSTCDKIFDLVIDDLNAKAMER